MPGWTTTSEQENKQCVRLRLQRASHGGKMGDDERAVNTDGSPRNGNSQPRVGVGVLLVDQQGRVLLTLREFPPDAGCWSTVGGKLDFLEALEEGAVREAF